MPGKLMKSWKNSLLAGAVGAWVASPAFADPRLDEKVYTPYVLNHVAELELRRGQQFDGPANGARTDVIELEYGLNDNVSLALVGNIERQGDGVSHLDQIGLESVIYLGQVPHLGVDVGIYLEYLRGQNHQRDAGEAKLLLAKNVDRFQALLNIIAEHPFGAPSGQGFSSYGYGASLTWRTWGALRLGAEAFGNLGDDHGLRSSGGYVGPQLTWEAHPYGSPFEVGIDAGWLEAFGAERDQAHSQARLTIELERHF